MPHVAIEDVKAARETIRDIAAHTPLQRAAGLSEAFDAEIYLKLDLEQPTGSFKIRGAANAVACLDEEQKQKGVVTASTGNFGRAMAHAARKLGVPATVCMSRLVPQNKVVAVRGEGATVEICGESQDEAGLRVAELVERDGMTALSPYDDYHVIAGQGTIGLELLDECPDMDVVLVPLSGGGLIAGVALALKDAKPDIRVIGVSTRRCPAMYESLKAGRPVDVVENESVADSLGGGIGLDNRWSFGMTRDLVGPDNVVLLDEDEIRRGMKLLYDVENITCEGAAAVGVAALAAGKIPDVHGKTVVCLVTGKNVDADMFQSIVA